MKNDSMIEELRAAAKEALDKKIEKESRRIVRKMCKAAERGLSHIEVEYDRDEVGDDFFSKMILLFEKEGFECSWHHVRGGVFTFYVSWRE